MQSLRLILVGLTLVTANAVEAKIALVVSKDAQTMAVTVDGIERYLWPVSTGRDSPSQGHQRIGDTRRNFPPNGQRSDYRSRSFFSFQD